MTQPASAADKELLERLQQAQLRGVVAPKAAPLPASKRRASFHWDRLPLVLFGWFVLGLWWATGGKYTIDGLPLFANTVFSFFHVPVELAPITNWRWYIGLCWIPIAISVIERRNRPRRGLAWSVIMVYAIGVWVVISMLDLGSTWLAVTNPAPDAFILSKQIAGTSFIAALWTGATTFLPEVGMAALWRYLRG